MMDCLHRLPLPAFISDPFCDTEGQWFLYQAEAPESLDGHVKKQNLNFMVSPLLVFHPPLYLIYEIPIICH